MNERITAAVRGWAEEEGITPAEFGKRLGYSYNHAYQVLKGDGGASVETVGRIALHYGEEAVGEVLRRMDGRPQPDLPHPDLPHPDPLPKVEGEE